MFPKRQGTEMTSCQQYVLLFYNSNDSICDKHQANELKYSTFHKEYKLQSNDRLLFDFELLLKNFFSESHQ